MHTAVKNTRRDQLKGRPNNRRGDFHDPSQRIEALRSPSQNGKFPKPKKTTAKRRKAAQDSHHEGSLQGPDKLNLVEIYFRQAGRKPKPTKVQEFRDARAIERARDKLVCTILSNGIFLAQIAPEIRVLKSNLAARTGHEPGPPGQPANLINIKVSSKREVMQRYRTVACNFETIEGLIYTSRERMRTAFSTETRSRQHDLETAHDINKVALRHAATLVTEFKLKRVRIKELYRDFQVFAERVRELRANLKLPITKEHEKRRNESRQELAKITREAGIKPDEILRQAMRAERLFDLWNARRGEFSLGYLKWAAKNAKGQQGKRVDIGDLIQVSNDRLMYAVDMFEFARGFRFTTYATQWMKQGLRLAVNGNAGVARIPPAAFAKMGKIKDFTHKFTEAEGRAPSTEEIMKGTRCKREEVYLTHVWEQHSVALDSASGTDDGATKADLVPETGRVSPEEEVDQTEQIDVLRREIELLPEMERDIVMRRFFPPNGSAETFAEIAAQMGTHRDKVREIHSQALARLRSKLGAF